MHMRTWAIAADTHVPLGNLLSVELLHVAVLVVWVVVGVVVVAVVVVVGVMKVIAEVEVGELVVVSVTVVYIGVSAERKKRSSRYPGLRSLTGNISWSITDRCEINNGSFSYSMFIDCYLIEPMD